MNNHKKTGTREAARNVAMLIASPRGQRGTTLLELMFAMIIFGTLLTIMAVFPSATAKSVKSVSDMRTATMSRSIRDAIQAAMESAFRADSTEDPPILITIVHDGLFPEAEFVIEDEEGEEEDDDSGAAGVLTLELPGTAEVFDVSIEEQELTQEGDEDREVDFLLAYVNNSLVRYPTSNNKVYKLAQYLRDKDSVLYNKYDNLHNYSFDIEIRQAVRERRPRDVNGNFVFTANQLRVYDLMPSVYEFHIRIYYKWKPQSEASRDKGLENPALIHHFSFMASAPELKVE